MTFNPALVLTLLLCSLAAALGCWLGRRGRGRWDSQAAPADQPKAQR